MRKSAYLAQTFPPTAGIITFILTHSPLEAASIHIFRNRPRTRSPRCSVVAKTGSQRKRLINLSCFLESGSRSAASQHFVSVDTTIGVTLLLDCSEYEEMIFYDACADTKIRPSCRAPTFHPLGIYAGSGYYGLLFRYMSHPNPPVCFNYPAQRLCVLSEILEHRANIIQKSECAQMLCFHRSLR